MKKVELRKIYLQKRSQLTPDQRVDLSYRISKLFFDQVYKTSFLHVHIFLPIIKFNEIDTWQIIRHFEQNKYPTRLLISRSDLQTGKMINYYYDPIHRLIENRWGIPEPETGDLCDNLSIDLVFVPLLVFDRNGHRVGYGKGFYDRFLSECRKDVLKVGLSYESPVESIEDVNENDVRLDCVITPERVYWF